MRTWETIYNITLVGVLFALWDSEIIQSQLKNAHTLSILAQCISFFMKSLTEIIMTVFGWLERACTES